MKSKLLVATILILNAPLLGKDLSTKTVPQKKYIKRNLEYWNNLSPEKKEGLIRQAETLRNLSPEEKKKLRSRIEQWRRLSPEERDELKSRFQSSQQH